MIMDPEKTSGEAGQGVGVEKSPTELCTLAHSLLASHLPCPL